MSVEKKVGVAICGFGTAGKIHFKGIIKNQYCNLKYIVDQLDVGEVKATIWSTLEKCMVEGVQLVDTEAFEEVVLKDSEVDAVFVTTPTNLHETYVRRALNAKKAVFCEKPISPEMTAINDCYNLANKVNTPLFCAFNRRFDPALSRLREQVREGKIGKVYHVKMTSRDAPLPTIAYLKISNGIFHDCGVHDIDMVCLVVGERPVGVFAQGSAFDPEIKAIGDLDTVAIVLKFPSGALASIELNRHSYDGYDQRIEVLGSKGMLQVGNPPKDEMIRLCEGEGGFLPSPIYSFANRYKESYKLELDHFLSVVLDPTLPMKVNKEDVLLSREVAEACERSFREGRMVIM